MKLTIFTSKTCGNASNVYYPQKMEVSTEEDFKKVVAFDHVAAEYKNHYRSNANFLHADHLCLDCDNEGSDDPKDWIWPKDITKIVSEVSQVSATSRNI